MVGYGEITLSYNIHSNENIAAARYAFMDGQVRDFGPIGKPQMYAMHVAWYPSIAGRTD
jgi:hypothetical protein